MARRDHPDTDERALRRSVPVSRAALRCLAIRWARDVWIVRCWLGGGLIGVLLFAGCFLAVSRLGLAVATGNAGQAGEGLRSLARDVPRMLMKHGDALLWLLGPPCLLLFFLPWMTRRAFDMASAGMTAAKMSEVRRQRRLNRRRFAVLGAICLALPAFIGVTGGMTPMVMVLALYGLVAGSAAILRAVTGRDGRGLACGRCGYAMRSWRAAPPQCTECGHAWRRMWGQTIGQRSLSMGWVGAGAVVLLASLVAAIVAMAGIE